MNKLTSEELQIALNDILKDENNDLTKKIVLLELGEDFLFKENNNESVKMILQSFDSI